MGLEERRIKDLVKKHSMLIGFPIELYVEKVNSTLAFENPGTCIAKNELTNNLGKIQDHFNKQLSVSRDQLIDFTCKAVKQSEHLLQKHIDELLDSISGKIAGCDA